MSISSFSKLQYLYHIINASNANHRIRWKTYIFVSLEKFILTSDGAVLIQMYFIGGQCVSVGNSMACFI